MWPIRWQNSRAAALTRLALWTVVLAIVWLTVLPFIGRQPNIDAYIQQNERLGIDPSAKFYTEVPAAPDLVERVQRRLSTETKQTD